MVTLPPALLTRCRRPACPSFSLAHWLAALSRPIQSSSTPQDSTRTWSRTQVSPGRTRLQLGGQACEGVQPASATLGEGQCYMYEEAVYRGRVLRRWSCVRDVSAGRGLRAHARNQKWSCAVARAHGCNASRLFSPPFAKSYSVTASAKSQESSEPNPKLFQDSTCPPTIQLPEMPLRYQKHNCIRD